MIRPKPGWRRNEHRDRFMERVGAGDLGVTWKEKLAGDLVLGGEDFAAKIRELAKGDRLEQKSLRALEKPPVNWETIIAAIEKLRGEP
jgi:hypothetical protein